MSHPFTRFNHKTGAEDVHFTLSPFMSEFASEKHGDTHVEEQSDSDVTDSHDKYSVLPAVDVSDNDDELVSPSKTESDDHTILEMILVTDVKSGSEVNF